MTRRSNTLPSATTVISLFLVDAIYAREGQQSTYERTPRMSPPPRRDQHKEAVGTRRTHNHGRPRSHPKFTLGGHQINQRRLQGLPRLAC